MKALLILLTIVVIGILWNDDHTKRAALDAAQVQADAQADNITKLTQQVQSLTATQSLLNAQLEQLKLIAARGAAAGGPAAQAQAQPQTPNWLQQRLNQTQSLDAPSGHHPPGH